MLNTERPSDFNPKFYAVGCFVEYQGKILLLHRQDTKPEGNTWGIPSGKVDAGENADTAMLRELRQETGIVVPDLDYFGEFFVRYSSKDFGYHIFYKKLDYEPDVKLSPREHKAFRWVSPQEALRTHLNKELPLIEDLDACIRLFYHLK